MLHQEKYRNHWKIKKAWYEKHGFASHLITTSEVDGFILTPTDAQRAAIEAIVEVAVGG